MSYCQIKTSIRISTQQTRAFNSLWINVFIKVNFKITQYFVRSTESNFLQIRNLNLGNEQVFDRELICKNFNLESINIIKLQKSLLPNK